MRGKILEKLTWTEAQIAIDKYPIILIPIGARCKEHGHHLPLNTDWVLAEYLARRIIDISPVLALPTLQYGYFPAFVNYPGSIHIEQQTFSNTIINICESLAKQKAQCFYFLDTGISTKWALEPARLTLDQKNITMDYSDFSELLTDIKSSLEEQEAGIHADEIETSMMLYISPDIVQMDKAEKDIHQRKGPGPLTRDPDTEGGLYSPTGAWGDPTLATVEKGKVIVEALVKAISLSLQKFQKETFVSPTPRKQYLTRTSRTSRS